MGSWVSVSAVVANDLPRDKWRRLAMFSQPDVASHLLVITPSEPIGLNVQSYGFVYLSVDADGQDVRFRSRVIPSPVGSPSSSGLTLGLAPQARFPDWTGPWYCNVSLPRWFPVTTVALFRYIP